MIFLYVLAFPAALRKDSAELTRKPMEMLGLPSQEGGGIGDELTASEDALRFGWASWAIHGLFKKLTDCGDAS